MPTYDDFDLDIRSLKGAVVTRKTIETDGLCAATTQCNTLTGGPGCTPGTGYYECYSTMYETICEFYTVVQALTCPSCLC